MVGMVMGSTLCHEGFGIVGDKGEVVGNFSIWQGLNISLKIACD
jgi:hypothetical protein